MLNRSQFHGIVPPIVTPFEADGQTVHESGVHQLIERLIQQGVHGIFIAGTTGEGWALDEPQWERLVRFAVEACCQRIPLYVGISHPATDGAVKRARRAEELGADAVVALPPYYLPATQAEIIRHYQAIAQATALPLILYQFPEIAKAVITLETYDSLTRVPNIVGIKDSQGDLTEFRQMVQRLRGDGRDVRLFLGSDTLTDVAILIGGQGTVPSLGNIAAAYLVEAYAAAVAGDWARSAAAQNRATPLKAIYAIPDGAFLQGMIASLKCALNLLGIPVGPPAAPLCPCDRAQAQAIEKILAASGILN